MIAFLMAALMVFSGHICDGSRQLDCCSSQRSKVRVTPINSSVLPVRLNAVSAESSLGETWLDYSISNISVQEIRRVELRVFSVDSNGNLIDMKETASTERIAAGATQRDRARVKGIVGEKEEVLMALNRVVTDTGIWQVDYSSLEIAVRNRFSRQPDATIGATFEPNVVVTEQDRCQIFRLIVSDMLGDERKSEKLQGQSELIVLRSSLDFPLPEIPDKKLVVLSQGEIQEIADQEKRVVFLKYEPLEVEGARVLARIAIRDAVTRQRGAFVQYKYAYLFICSKENDRWIIEKSIGYAQG